MKASELERSMEMAMSICEKEHEDEQTKRKKVDLFVFLPDDILSDILKRLPEPFRGYRAKYVCRRWLDLMGNRSFLAHASFILQKRRNLAARHVVIREEGEGLQVKVQETDIPGKGKIKSWGNEILLISSAEEGEKGSLYGYNLMTKEGSYLPKCNASCGGDCTLKCGVAISYDGCKGIYKVVHLFSGPPIECHILILGEDIVSSNWKNIHAPCMNIGGWSFSDHNPVSVQGRYIHWRVNNDDTNDEKRLISMDMVKEEIADISLPLPGDCMDYTIFEMGGSLALFAGVSKDKSEIWILTDFKRKTWEKLQPVTLENYYSDKFPSFGVISSNKYIILKCIFNKDIWYYDLKNGVVKKLDIHIDLDDCCEVHSSPPSFK